MDDQLLRETLARLGGLEEGAVKVRLATVVTVTPTLTVTFDDGETTVTAVPSATAPVGVDHRVVCSLQGANPPLVIANLSAGFGSRFGPSPIASINNGTVGTANRMEYQEVQVLNPCPVTGIQYYVAAAASGNVKSALYNEQGELVARREATSSAQSLAGAFGHHPVAFDAPVVIPPGLYIAAILFNLSTATRYTAGCAGRGGTQNIGSFVCPTTITPPTSASIQCIAATY